MTHTLTWPRRSRFLDRDAGVDVTGPDATAEVPDEHVDRYLSRGWEHADTEADDDTDTSTEPDAGDTDDASGEGTTDDGTDGADDTDAAADATDPTDAAADDDGDDTEEEEGAFDAAEFVAGHWNAVASGITDGEADGHLQAVEEAERARGDDGGMRDSVATALEDRRAETGA